MLIDGNSLTYRAFHALPTDLQTSSGQVTNAVFGFTSMMLNLVRDHRPDRVVVTFDRHPAQVIRPESAPLLLTDLDQKLELLENTGIDIAVVVRFDMDRASETAEEFVREVLVGCLNAKSVVVGEDFHFGHRRAGNVALLSDMGAELGFEVSGVRLVGPDGEPARDDAQVSSTAIRRALHDG